MPAPKPGEIRVVDQIDIPEEVKPQEVYSSLWSDFPVQKRIVRQWAKVALSGGSIALNKWCGEGKPFKCSGDDGYEAFLEFMRGVGVLEIKNPGAPHPVWEVTYGGYKALERLLETL